MKKVSYWLIWGLSIFAMLVAITFIVSNIFGKQDAYFFGYKPYIIVGESMEPTIKKYGVILVKQVDMSKIQTNDIISFKFQNTNACHRAITITEDGIITKGDNSKIADQQIVTADNFNGKVIFYTNFIANYLSFYAEHGIFIALILPILAIVLLIISINWLIRVIKKNKHPVEDEV